MTQEEKRLKAIEYRKANPDKIKASVKKYALKNLDKRKEYDKKRYYSDINKAREKSVRYNENNKEKIKLYQTEYSKLNKVKIKVKNTNYRLKNSASLKEKQKLYNSLNKDKHNIRIRLKRKHDSLFGLKTKIGNSIRKSFKNNGYTKKSNTYKILGCSISDFKLHLESQFKDWMNWNNRGLYNGIEGYGWDIDHIIPLSTATCEADVICLNHYTNLQPLCSYLNRVVKRNLI
jgi:hypothetical protein